MSDQTHPVKLEKLPDSRALLIAWSDGVEQQLSYRTLRDLCPCAHCLDKRMKGEPEKKKPAELTVLSAAQLQPLDIVGMRPVGNYAYNVSFSDGHGVGIYPFALLRKLGDLDAAAEAD